jgi:hypothetical protein
MKAPSFAHILPVSARVRRAGPCEALVLRPRGRSTPNRSLLTAFLLAAVCWLGPGTGFAQPATDGGGSGRRGFDPAQIQNFLLQNYREQLEIKDDAEWDIVRERIQKVLEARRDTAFGGMGMMAGMFRRGGRGGGTDAGGAPGGNRGLAGLLPQAGPEEEALQKAIDAKAANAELKAALAKFQEARRQKQAQLEKAQTDLRAVLSVRQEAIASLSGLL